MTALNRSPKLPLFRHFGKQSCLSTGDISGSRSDDRGQTCDTSLHKGSTVHNESTQTLYVLQDSKQMGRLTGKTDLTSHSTALQMPSQRYWPDAQGPIIWRVRVTLAFLLGMDKSNTVKVMLKVVPTGREVFTAHDLIPCCVNL